MRLPLKLKPAAGMMPTSGALPPSTRADACRTSRRKDLLSVCKYHKVIAPKRLGYRRRRFRTDPEGKRAARKRPSGLKKAYRGPRNATSSFLHDVPLLRPKPPSEGFHRHLARNEEAAVRAETYGPGLKLLVGDTTDGFDGFNDLFRRRNVALLIWPTL